MLEQLGLPMRFYLVVNRVDFNNNKKVSLPLRVPKRVHRFFQLYSKCNTYNHKILERNENSNRIQKSMFSSKNYFPLY